MKYILSLLTLSSFAILAGCASDPASVNYNSGTTETLNQNESTEVVVENTNEEGNTNTEVESDEVDMSDWKTYTNEEYGLSFKYPSDYLVTMNNADVGSILDPTSTVRGKINIENSESFSGMSEREILMTEPGKETMPLKEERFLTINTLQAYRSVRQLKKGELLYPTAEDSTEHTELTNTEIEYRYRNNSSLIRLTFNIEGENYQNFYEIVDAIAHSFSM